MGDFKPGQSISQSATRSNVLFLEDRRCSMQVQLNVTQLLLHVVHE